MKFFASLFLMCIFLPIIFLVVFTPEKCEHEEVTRYVFTSYDSTGNSSVAKFCKKCDKRLTYHSLFKGDLVDKSYLNVIKEHSDGSEIVPGEYYTVTATAPLGSINGTPNRLYLHCEVENEDFIIRFVVDFREEFREVVTLVEEGEEITFRGRFYDEGCGFTDAELINTGDTKE